ncbi:MAG: BON domain-containing protein [Gemmatimonadetes bacterium]|nr:BON domain-containing protein [Gemmatimonadota bacterium]
MAKDEQDRSFSSLAIKIGIAGAIGLGAIASGLIISRKGRHLVKEAMEGRRRTRIEDRVLDALWGDPVLGRREIDVEEVGEGTVVLTGELRSEEERRRALALVGQVKGVSAAVDRFTVVATKRRRPRRAGKVRRQTRR